jgi:hypothetical protein
MKKSFLYLLIGAGSSAGHFKLGHSVDPYHRARTLPQQFDLSRSLQLAFARTSVGRVEKHLHIQFAQYQINPEKIGDHEGKNEWFDMACFDDAVSYINGRSGSLQLESIEQGTHRIIVPIPMHLYKRMLLSCIDTDTPVQHAVVDLIQQVYGDQEHGTA